MSVAGKRALLEVPGRVLGRLHIDVQFIELCRYVIDGASVEEALQNDKALCRKNLLLLFR